MAESFFDIGGNKYRIVARIAYGPYYRVMVKFAGTHQQYNAINPEISTLVGAYDLKREYA